MSTNVDRRAKVLAELESRGCQALVVTHLPSVRYLTGYVGSNGTAVISPAGTALITDSRYAVSAAQAIDSGTELVVAALESGPAVIDALARLTPDGATIAVEAAHISMARAQALGAKIAETGGRTMAGHSGIVEAVRVVKDEGEKALMRESARINDAALARVLEHDLVGRTEREVAWDIQRYLNEEGADGLSFDCIVAAGANGARPHAVPSNAVIEDNTLVVIDMGAVHDGYCSDMTRTIPVGAPPARLLEIYDVCLRAQRAALAAVRPGIACKDVDAVAREIITEAGYGEQFGHGLGHGVGLEIHEAPRLSRQGEGVLASGMAVTIEPGIYLEGLGGVRIEDLVLVTDDGAEVLSHAPIAQHDE